MDWIMVIRPCRRTFLDDSTEEERDLVGRHFQYLKSNFEAGRVRFVGRCADATFGLAVFKASNLMEADEFVKGDPAVAAGVFVPELREFYTVFPPNAESTN